MRLISLFFAVLIAVGRPAEAEQTPESRWDAAITAGWFGGKPGPEGSSRYDDDWYGAGRYAVQAGYYWTEHLKAEVEFARSGEGAIYRTEFRNATGSPNAYPYNFETFHRLDQISARTVWQFGHNAWVHPYVSGGIVGERDRRHTYAPPQYQYPGSGSTPALMLPAVNSETTSDYRVGITASAGAKIYMSQRAFFNTGIAGSWSHPAQTITLLAGFGFDF
jgi:hypothetical protein